MLTPDRFIVEFDKGLRTLFSQAHSVRPYPDADMAIALGGAELPQAVQTAMKLNGKIMTSAAYRV